MEYEVAFRTSVIMILMMGGIMGVFVVVVNIMAKIQTANKWYAEFNSRGEITFQLVADTGGILETKHGEYNLPDKPRMFIGWPLGLPGFMQVHVRHEKYAMGNPDPLDLPNMEDDVGLAVLSQQTHLSNATALKNANDTLAAVGGRQQVLMIVMAIGIVLAVVTAGVAAFYGYQINESQAAVVSALGGL